MTPHAALLAAAELIERDGLCRGEFWEGYLYKRPYTVGAPCCPIGALRIVTGKTVVDLIEHPAVKALAEQVDVGHLVYLYGWADRSTQAEVVTAMRSAAETISEDK